MASDDEIDDSLFFEVEKSDTEEDVQVESSSSPPSGSKSLSESIFSTLKYKRSPTVPNLFDNFNKKKLSRLFSISKIRDQCVHRVFLHKGSKHYRTFTQYLHLLRNNGFLDLSTDNCFLENESQRKISCLVDLSGESFETGVIALVTELQITAEDAAICIPTFFSTPGPHPNTFDKTRLRINTILGPERFFNYEELLIRARLARAAEKAGLARTSNEKNSMLLYLATIPLNRGSFDVLQSREIFLDWIQKSANQNHPSFCEHEISKFAAAQKLCCLPPSLLDAYFDDTSYSIDLSRIKLI
jgi:hypothetical protein